MSARDGLVFIKGADEGKEAIEQPIRCSSAPFTKDPDAVEVSEESAR